MAVYSTHLESYPSGVLLVLACLCLTVGLARFASGRSRVLDGDDGDRGLTSPWKGWGARRSNSKAEQQVDADSQGELTAEIDAWNVSYLADQVFGTPGKGEAQERRARALCKISERGTPPPRHGKQ